MLVEEVEGLICLAQVYDVPNLMIGISANSLIFDGAFIFASGNAAKC